MPRRLQIFPSHTERDLTNEKIPPAPDAHYLGRLRRTDLAVHEGFPGHDWHFKVMTQYKADIAPVRGLTPGAVEDSSSMWQDSMASEGWALYSEALLASPRSGF